MRPEDWTFSLVTGPGQVQDFHLTGRRARIYDRAIAEIKARYRRVSQRERLLCAFFVYALVSDA